MRGQDLAHLIADTHRRMERDRRFLIDQRDSSAANALPLSSIRLENIPPLESDAALLDPSICRKQTQKRCSQGALPRSRFSEHAQDFPGPDVKTDIHKGGTKPARARKVGDVKIPYFQNERHVPGIGNENPA